MAEASTPSEELNRVLSASVDEALGGINIEYASKRESGRLDPLEVVTVPQHALSAYVESRRQGGNATQYKYKPFQQDIDFVAAVAGR